MTKQLPELHHFGEYDEPPTQTEIALLAREPVDTNQHADRLHASARRFAQALEREGWRADQAAHASALAIVEILTEFGGQRVRFPERQLFWQHLVRPVLPELVVLLRPRMRMTEIADRLGVHRRTLERAMRQKGGALSQCERGESRK